MYVHTVHTLRIILCGLYSLLLFFKEDFIITKLKIDNLRFSQQKNKVKYTYIYLLIIINNNLRFFIQV